MRYESERVVINRHRRGGLRQVGLVTGFGQVKHGDGSEGAKLLAMGSKTKKVVRRGQNRVSGGFYEKVQEPQKSVFRVPPPTPPIPRTLVMELALFFRILPLFSEFPGFDPPKLTKLTRKHDQIL